MGSRRKRISAGFARGRWLAVSVCPKAPCDRYDRVVLTGKANELRLNPAPVGIRSAIHSVLFQGILCLFRGPHTAPLETSFPKCRSRNRSARKQWENEKAMGERESNGRTRKQWENEKAMGERGSCRAADAGSAGASPSQPTRRPPNQRVALSTPDPHSLIP